MKTILVVYYSQTGQLKSILDSLLSPLSNSSDFLISHLEIKPETAFPFPWTRRQFLDVFPETVAKRPVLLKPPEIEIRKPYDLLIIAFQPWYLSPSLPVSSFLNSTFAEEILRDTNVLTLIGARNMWQEAFNWVKDKVEGYGGRLCGNIALVDRAPNLVSVVTIAYWMLTGKKDRFLGIFPKPGVSEADIGAANRFGKAIGAFLLGNKLDLLDGELKKLGAAENNPSLIRLERRGKKIFTLWSNLIIKAPNLRGLLLNLFFAELLLALAIVSPINSLQGILMKFLKRKSSD
jgi:hypothetical protein